MPFTSYASIQDVKVYAGSALVDLYDGDQDLVKEHLEASARTINEQLIAMDNVDSDNVPIPEDANDLFPQILIEWNVYEAIWIMVRDQYGGEAFDSVWRWLRAESNRIKSEVSGGTYGFGPDPDEVGDDATRISLARSSV